MDRVGFRKQLGNDGVACFMVGSNASFLFSDNNVFSVKSHDELIFGIVKIIHIHLLFSFSCGE